MSTHIRQWIILLPVALGIPVFTLWNYRSGGATKNVALSSAGISLVVLFAVILWGLRKASLRNGTTLPKFLLIELIGLAAVSFAITLVGVSIMKHHNNLLDLAQSETPLADIVPEQKRLVVQLIRRQAANSHEDDKLIAEVRAHPLNPSLYSAESFASKETMVATVTGISAVIGQDIEYSQKQQGAMKDFREQMAIADPAYLKSWDEARREQDERDETTLQMEQHLLTDIKSLYGYAEQHSNEIHVQRGRILIPANDVRETFNRSLTNAKELNQELNRAVTASAKVQQSSKDELVIP